MSLASGDLTTLFNVRQYFTFTPSDALILSTIPRISRLIHSAINRPLLVPKQYTEQYDGNGNRILQLVNWPLITLNSLSISGSSISLLPPTTQNSFSNYGYRFQSWNNIPPGDPAIVELSGATYVRGNKNVNVSYLAGYMVSNEVAVIPSSAPYIITPIAPYGFWATDQGVTFSSGVALAAVVSPAIPVASQYVPPDLALSTPRLTYTFSAADVGKTVSLSYGFVPAEVEQLAIELISERLTYRSRVGIRSQSLAGQETISYDNSGITAFIQRELNQYCSVLPPAIGVNI